MKLTAREYLEVIDIVKRQTLDNSDAEEVEHLENIIEKLYECVNELNYYSNRL